MRKLIYYLTKDYERYKGKGRIPLKIKYQHIVFRLGFYGYHCINNKLAKIFIMLLYYPLKITCYFMGVDEMPHYSVYVDEGLRVPHGFGSVKISPAAKIGKNVTLLHNVTIGVIENEDYAFGDIEIKDDVYIGCGAAIIGKCKIGNNVSVGANALIVNKNIPDNSICLGQQAVVQPKK